MRRRFGAHGARYGRATLPVLLLAIVAACGGAAPSAPAATGSPTTASPLAPSAPIATAPAATALETAIVTAAPTAVPPTAVPVTAQPAPSLAPIRIDEVECLTGLTVRMQVRATVDATIASWEVWSTWGGGGGSKEVLTAPFPSTVDEVIEFTHDIVDPIATRIHEFGLAVTVTSVADPIIVYAFEPDGRCAGH